MTIIVAPYRHLAYLQTGLVFDVDRMLPGTRDPEIEALIARCYAC